MAKTNLTDLRPGSLEMLAKATGLLAPADAMPLSLIEYTEILVRHCAAVARECRGNGGDPCDEILKGFELR
jgi:hypothetical protein